VRKLSVIRQTRGGSLVGTGLVAAAVLALAACTTSSAPVQPPGSPSGSQSSSTAASTPPTQPPSASSTPGGPNSLAGFQVLSMSFVSDQRGWALGTISCGTGRCVALLSTPDGGSTWSRLTAPTRAAGGVYNTCPTRQPCVQQVRFATPLIGYAYDPSLLLTTDGGQRWRQLSGLDVSSLEAADGTAVRVASNARGCSGTSYQVDSAPVGSTVWGALPAPAVMNICPPVMYRQGERLVLAGYGNPAGGVLATAQIARSGDGGRTWASGPDHCGRTQGYASDVTLAPPDVLVVLCQNQQPNPNGSYPPAWVRVSLNGGATFGPDQQVPSRSSAPAGVIERYQLAAASANRLLVVETGVHTSKVLLSENGGRTWSTPLNMSSGSPVVLVGYEDPLTARIAQADTVWTTRDGGQTWTANHFSTS